MNPAIQFAKRKDGVNIAFSKFGEGRPLVIAPPWVTSLRFIIEDPFMNRFVDRLARNVMVIFYDKHGCGESDENRLVFDLETELFDLETVVDHLDLKKFNLLGSSMAGPVSIAYTARHPHRVKRLILYGTYADGQQVAPKKIQHALISLLEASWGLGSKTIADIFTPDAKAEEIQAVARYQRLSSTSEIAIRLLEYSYSVDVTGDLARLRNPTLILHREGDKAISIRLGRQLASAIPNSRFKILSGNSHPLWTGDSNKIIQEILEFVDEGEADLQDSGFAADADQDAEVIEQATIVFTDIISSTNLVAQAGDLAARDLFLKHDRIIQNLLSEFGGRELQNLGDGFMLAFASASAAIKCACGIQQQLSEAMPSIQVRIGINTGEVVRRQGKHPFGQAVVVASRIVSQCKGGQVLVSDITKKLVAGSRFSFIRRGRFKPKGIDESIELFEVVQAESGK